MKKLLLSLLAASVLLFVSTFAGMGVFGMQGVMRMSTDACIGADCGSVPSAAHHEADCIDHCLSTVAAFTRATPVSEPTFVVFVVLFIFLLLDYRAANSVFSALQWKWRECIRLPVLAEAHSTVVLRN